MQNMAIPINLNKFDPIKGIETFFNLDALTLLSQYLNKFDPIKGIETCILNVYTFVLFL